MNLFNKSFITAVVVIDLAALVYFGGNYILTGELMPEDKPMNEVITQAEAMPTEEVELASTNVEPEIFVVDPKAGKKLTGKCKACHTFDKGGKNSIGPNLWGVYNNNYAAKSDFKYSSALESKKSNKWTEETLNEWLIKPAKFIPGNKMSFAGLKKEKDRANLIAYLKTLK